MLCFEGIAMALNVFRGKMSPPNFKLTKPEKLETITVSQSTEEIRPYVAGAILRNVTFTKANYESFISLQDKLHANLARNRTLVAIGTHDLDTLSGPFTYEALPPNDFQFVPLNQTESLTGAGIMDFYSNHRSLSKFLPIIQDKPRYPLILDSKRTICSMPPIINSDHSKITLNTKNVFIEMTATDRTKLEIVNNTLVAMFSMYCAEPFTIEPVEVISKHNGESRITPNIEPLVMEASVEYIKRCCGINSSPETISELLTKMCLSAKPATNDADKISVVVPITRTDILHQCDIMEDVAVAYGFNSLPRSTPHKSVTIGKALPINKLSDIVRSEAAMSGWSEVLPLILCSHDELFSWLNRKDDGTTAVKLANPKTLEYQVVRTSLLPGLLKTIRENKHHAVPIKIFEASDVCFKDLTRERKARNQRNFAAAWYGKSSGFEQVHGLLDRILLMLKTALVTRESDLKPTMDEETKLNNGYWIEELDDATFFAGHSASIWLRLDGKEVRIGEFGILHPSVLEKFDLR